MQAPLPHIFYGLGSFPFARRYLGNRFYFLFLWVLRCFNSPRVLSISYVFRLWVSWVYHDGFPHSESPGSTLAYSSPKIIVVSHVLLRHLVPRHPPYALCSISLLFSLYPTSIKLVNELFIKLWWRISDSNRWPLPCKGSALPAKLIPQNGGPGLIWTADLTLIRRAL